jgi:hypothetical protein
MSMIKNERIKLFATALSNTGVATVVTAIIAPMAGLLYGSGAITSDQWPFIGLAWFLGGFVLHVCAQVALGRLRE